MATRPTLMDQALVGDAGHTTDHNIIRDALIALFEERTTTTGDPEGVVTAPVGAMHVNSTSGALWVKLSGTGNTGWANAQAGATQHSMLSGLTSGNDHTQYQLGAAKGVANGYASLGATTKVPIAQIPTGTDGATVALGDHVHPNLVPVGAVIAYGGTAAPSGWLLCDGTTIPAQYTVLIALVGSVTPNLKDRFIVGAGSAYGVKNTGGVDSVTLTAAQSGMPSHNHGASSGTVSNDHLHWIDPPNTNTSTNAHNHTLSVREGTGTGDGAYLDTNPTDGGNGNVTLAGTVTSTYSHAHSVDIAGFWSGGINQNHTHGITVDYSGTANATASHENRPPYYALTYIIRAS